MKNDTLTTILNSGQVSVAYRVFVSSPTWEEQGDGKDAMFMPKLELTNGEYNAISVEDLEFSRFGADWSFMKTQWLEITPWVAKYSYNKDSSMVISQLSLEMINDTWFDTYSPARIYKAMNIIRVFEYYSDGENTVTLPRCTCISDGYNETWKVGDHPHIVNAKGCFKLASLDILGDNASRVDFFKGDVAAICHKEQLNNNDMAFLQETDTAYEFGFLSDLAEDNKAVYSNWAESPAPKIWFSTGYGPIPLEIAGAAVEIVYGEGVVRVNKQYCIATNDGGRDFGSGLGLPVGTPPQLFGNAYRYLQGKGAKEAYAWHNPPHVLPADVHEKMLAQCPPGVTVNDLYGVVYVTKAAYFKENYAQNIFTIPTSELTGYDCEMRLTTGTFHTYKVIKVDYYAVINPATNQAEEYMKLTLSNPTAYIGPSTPVTCGYVNRIQDVLQHCLRQAGILTALYPGLTRTIDLTKTQVPIATYDIDVPKTWGSDAQDLVLPPMIYKQADGKKVSEFFTDLKSQGYIPPNYVLYEDATGAIDFKNIEQNALTDSRNIPVDYIISELTQDHSDTEVYTKVLVRGKARSAQNLTDGTYDAYLSSDVNAFNWTLPTVSTPTGEPAQWKVQNMAFLGNVLRPNLKIYESWQPYWMWLAQYSPTVSEDGYAPNQWQATGCYQWAMNMPLIEWHTNAPMYVDKFVIDCSILWGDKTLTEYFSWSLPQVLSIEYKDELMGWTTLIPAIECDPQSKEPIKTISSDSFSTKSPVQAQYFRVVCIRPYIAGLGTHDESYGKAQGGVFLRNIQMYESPEIWGFAELGSAENYVPDGTTIPELSGTSWQDLLAIYRKRTYTVPDIIPWVNDERTAKWLAMQWLKDKLKNLSAMSFSVIRPDIDLYDTIEFDVPEWAGVHWVKCTAAMVTNITYNSDGTQSLSCIDYTNGGIANG